MPGMSLRFPSSRRFHWAAGLALATAALLTVAALRAPQVFVLASEGFPQATWPAPGSYARVEGATASGDPPTGAPPPPAALARLQDSGGRALLMDRGGRLTEAYGEGTTRDTALNSFSLVKSLVGALVLRAIADGRLDGLDTPLRDILGPEAPAATLREALTMTSGLVLPQEPPKPGSPAPLDDAGFSPFSALARLHAFGPEAVLPDLRVDEALRGRFRYQSANTALLGLVLERAYGRPLPDLLSDLIWKPAGAADAWWRTYPSGEGVSAYCCLYARPLDWLRVGRFLLDNGLDNGAEAPFLPLPLWREFVLPSLDAEARQQGAYGLHLRHDVLDRTGEALQGPFAYLMGHRGQMVYLLPEEDTVVVRFGADPQLLHSTLYELVPS